jgi:hypothetical protein
LPNPPRNPNPNPVNVALDMLEAAPVRRYVSAAAVAAAITACLEAAQACVSCADSSLAEPDVDTLRECIALDLRCADICVATAWVLSRPARLDRDLAASLLASCIRVCEACATECGRHAAHHPHCGICSKACRECVAACRAVVDTESLTSSGA